MRRTATGEAESYRGSGELQVKRRATGEAESYRGSGELQREAERHR